MVILNFFVSLALYLGCLPTHYTQDTVYFIIFDLFSWRFCRVFWCIDFFSPSSSSFQVVYATQEEHYERYMDQEKEYERQHLWFLLHVLDIDSDFVSVGEISEAYGSHNLIAFVCVCAHVCVSFRLSAKDLGTTK